jgi:uncharacterized protein YdeI (YjbR/CyaY-like superfamily)
MPTTNPAVDTYIANAAPFAQPILERIRRAFHKGCPELEEKIKWGVPSFEHKGMLGGMAAFKAHVSFGFWKASLMDDPEGLFGGDCKASFMGIKATDAKELPTQKVIVAYVKAAKKLNDDGVKLPSRKPGKRSAKDLDVPAYFLDAVKADAAAHTTWKGFSYTHQKEYVQWVTDAKREATRDKRLAQAVAWMAEGKSRNWKYR